MPPPADPITEVWRYLRERWRDERSASSTGFDEALGVRTARWTLSGYEPVPIDIAAEVMAAMPLPAEGATFIDLGCGKGRMLLLAARHPFAAVWGVDHDPGLIRTAQANLRAADDPARRCPETSALLLDAREVPWPATPLVVFLYNPFPADVLDPVLASLERSLTDGRPAALVYVNPLFDECLHRRGWRKGPAGGEGVSRWGWWFPPGR